MHPTALGLWRQNQKMYLLEDLMKWGSGATAFELSLPSLVEFLSASFTTGDPNTIRLQEKEQQIQMVANLSGSAPSSRAPSRCPEFIQ